MGVPPNCQSPLVDFGSSVMSVMKRQGKMGLPLGSTAASYPTAGYWALAAVAPEAGRKGETLWSTEVDFPVLSMVTTCRTPRVKTCSSEYHIFRVPASPVKATPPVAGAKAAKTSDSEKDTEVRELEDE